MRIGIAGAGVAGLAAAALLADLGHDVTLIDQFDTPRPVGSGLVIQPVGRAVLRLITTAAPSGADLHRMLGHAAGGRRVLDVSYGATPGLAIHRSSLFHLLWQAAMARPVTMVTATRVTGRDGQRIITRAGADTGAASGTRSGTGAGAGSGTGSGVGSGTDPGSRTGTGALGPFDLIVDALGAGSALSPLRARPLSYGAIWATVDWPDTTALPRDALRQRYRGARNMVGVLPLGRLPGGDRDKAALFWSLPRDGHQGWLDRGLPAWRDAAIDLWPESAPFVSQITDPAQMTMARYSHGALWRPHGPGIVHLGDAAHRASPQLGQGANMALLDALALARALQMADGQDPLALYAAARRWHVQAYQALSAAFTPQYQSDSRLLPVIRDHLLAPLSQVWPVTRILTRLVRGDLVPPIASLDRVDLPRALR